jgi:hypothetical protein
MQLYSRLFTTPAPAIGTWVECGPVSSGRPISTPTGDFMNEYVDEGIGRSEVTPGMSKPQPSEVSGARITSSDSPEERGFKAPESFEKPESVPFYLETE